VAVLNSSLTSNKAQDHSRTSPDGGAALVNGTAFLMLNNTRISNIIAGGKGGGVAMGSDR